jgi:hypothetical protein|tara:strand:- start:2019 stop:2507 length:489 start_codon:yes stop_codon:yes gene_type:complete
MAKLKGAKKAAFLKRMALGRRKAASRGTKTVKKTLVQRRKTTTKRRVTAKVKRRTTIKKPMVKRRSKSIRRRSSSMGRGIGSSLKTGVIGDVVKGIGAGSLVSLVMSRVAPNSSITPIAATGAAFLTGGIVGGAANLILTGGLSQLGGMFGGASTPQQEFGV